MLDSANENSGQRPPVCPLAVDASRSCRKVATAIPLTVLIYGIQTSCCGKPHDRGRTSLLCTSSCVYLLGSTPTRVASCPLSPHRRPHEVAKLLLQWRQTLLLQLYVVQDARHFRRPLLECIELRFYLDDPSASDISDIAESTPASADLVTFSIDALKSSITALALSLRQPHSTPVPRQLLTSTALLVGTCSPCRRLQRTLCNHPKSRQGRRNRTSGKVGCRRQSQSLPQKGPSLRSPVACPPSSVALLGTKRPTIAYNLVRQIDMQKMEDPWYTRSGL